MTNHATAIAVRWAATSIAGWHLTPPVASGWSGHTERRRRNNKRCDGSEARRKVFIYLPIYFASVITKTLASLLNGNCDITQQLITPLIKLFRDQLWNTRISAGRCRVSAWNAHDVEEWSFTLGWAPLCLLPFALVFTPPASACCVTFTKRPSHAPSSLTDTLVLAVMREGSVPLGAQERLFYTWRGFCVKQGRGHVP